MILQATSQVLNSCLGISEIVLIGFVLLILVAPEKAGDYAATIKKGLAKAKEVQDDVSKEAKDLIEPIEEMKVQTDELKTEISDQINQLKN